MGDFIQDVSWSTLSALTELSLSGNNFGSNHATVKELCSGLLQSYIQVLCIAECGFHAEAIEIMSSQVPSSKLTCINVLKNPVGEV